MNILETAKSIDRKGVKNLITNGRKLIQQRGTTGGRKQVVLNTKNLGGSATISFTGTATATIKEATTLGASDALTTWDTPLVSGATSGTTVTLTANKYLHIEFSTIDFDLAQLEKGSVATNFEVRHNELELCLPYYEQALENTSIPNYGTSVFSSNIYQSTYFEVQKISTPIMSYALAYCTGNIITITKKIFTINGTATSSAAAARYTSWTANAEIFNADDGVGISYKEDRWYV